MRNTRPDIKPGITNVVVAIPIHQTIVRTVIQITANVSNTQDAILQIVITEVCSV